jgi:hypothetical protein
MSIGSIAGHEVFRGQWKFWGGRSSRGSGIFAHKGYFARPKDVELRSNVVRNTVLFGLDASFWFRRSQLSEMLNRAMTAGPPYDRSSMTLSLILLHPRARRWFAAAAAEALIVLVSGCASPGPPQPPSLNLPEVVKDLSAERVGDMVHLHWTTPEMTTDHIDIKSAMTAEICRVTGSTPASQTPACTPISRLPVQSGPTQGAETLPPVLTADPPALLAYRVQIFNVHGHSAGLSAKAFTAGGAAPPPVEQLRATPTREGAMLEWQKKSTSATVELDRLPVGPDGVVVEPPQRKAASKSSSRLMMKKQPTAGQPKPASTPRPLQMTAPAPIEVKLRTPIQPEDPGGTIDHTAQAGETYHYTAQRVRSVSLGGHTVELRSTVSSPATVAMRDTFPPHAPSGLEALPGGATPADRSIDLSWTPDTDADLAGYIVYRQEVDAKGVAAGTATRLNITPVVGPAYRDQTAMAGHRYAYRVTAVDTAGNESAPSAEVQETLREQ